MNDKSKKWIVDSGKMLQKYGFCWSRPYRQN